MWQGQAWLTKPLQNKPIQNHFCAICLQKTAWVVWRIRMLSQGNPFEGNQPEIRRTTRFERNLPNAIAQVELFFWGRCEEMPHHTSYGLFRRDFLIGMTACSLSLSKHTSLESSLPDSLKEIFSRFMSGYPRCPGKPARWITEWRTYPPKPANLRQIATHGGWMLAPPSTHSCDSVALPQVLKVHKESAKGVFGPLGRVSQNNLLDGAKPCLGNFHQWKNRVCTVRETPLGLWARKPQNQFRFLRITVRLLWHLCQGRRIANSLLVFWAGRKPDPLD